jgi:hypothetical protein
MADARAVDLSSLLPSCSTDHNGRALAFLRGGAPCVRALAARDGALAFITRGGELWQMPVQLAMMTAAAAAPMSPPEAHIPSEAQLAAGSPSPTPQEEEQQQPQRPSPRLEVLAGSPRLVAQGHSALGRGEASHGDGGGEACALCTHPTTPLTHPLDPTRCRCGCGASSSSSCWRCGCCRAVWAASPTRPMAALMAIHLAAGCADGHVTVLHADSLEVGDYNT